MTVLPTEYAAFLASLGNPEHHVMVGTDWWACLCGAANGPLNPGAEAGYHAWQVGADVVQVPWQWSHVEADGQTAAELHFSLWECEDIDPRKG
jgi:hypothetical protein